MISDKELHEELSLIYTKVSMRLAANRPITNLYQRSLQVTRDQPLSLEGFWDILYKNKWADALQWLEGNFDPRTLLQWKPNTTAPLGTALKSSSLRRSKLQQTYSHSSDFPTETEIYNRIQSMTNYLK